MFIHFSFERELLSSSTSCFRPGLANQRSGLRSRVCLKLRRRFQSVPEVKYFKDNVRENDTNTKDARLSTVGLACLNILSWLKTVSSDVGLLSPYFHWPRELRTGLGRLCDPVREKHKTLRSVNTVADARTLSKVITYLFTVQSR